MKRFHVHLAVKDLDASVEVYTKLFGAPPTALKADYAKWMLEDPRINFAVSQRGLEPGVDHLGVQVESEDELRLMREQAAAAQLGAIDQLNAECCYARSDKYWVTDPQGIAWEAFHTLDSIPRYGEASRVESAECCAAKSSACCA